MNKTNKKGFTLAELLIVVAIIAVLVAIAIPVFTSQLEKANQATDAANIRAAYAEAAAESITKDGAEVTKTTTQSMKSAFWDKMDDDFNIAGVGKDRITKTKDKKMKVTVNGTTVTFTSES